MASPKCVRVCVLCVHCIHVFINVEDGCVGAATLHGAELQELGSFAEEDFYCGPPNSLSYMHFELEPLFKQTIALQLEEPENRGSSFETPFLQETSLFYL